MSQPVEPVIGFVDRKEDGCFPVLGADGSRIVEIRVPWYGGRFAAVTVAGQPLCTGSVPTFSRTFEVKDPSGALLLALRSSFWNGKKRTITHRRAHHAEHRHHREHVIGIVQANRILVKNARASAAS